MQRSEVTIANEQKSEVTTFSVCATAEDMNATAIIQVGEANEDGKKRKYLDYIGERKNSPDGFICYEYDLETPLQPKETRKLIVLQITTNHLQPYPKERKQSESPKVLVTMPETFVSCYKIKKEVSSLMITTTQDVIQRAGTRKFEQQKQTLKFATAENLSPFHSEIFKVQVSMNQPIMRARSVERDIHVSHWGHIRVREDYDVVNLGSSITGEFSRLLTMMSTETGMQGAAHTLKSKIPATSYDIRYRDEIGNISTSRMASSGSWTALALDPRFPIFGGWSAHFILEYSVQLDAMVEKKSMGQYSVAFPSLPSIVDITYDHIVTRVHLPGGARVTADPKLGYPGTLSISKEYTYFSILPSPVLTIVQENAVTDMATVAEFIYGYQDILRFEKIAIVGLTLVGFIMFFGFLSSIDLGAGKSKSV